MGLAFIGELFACSNIQSMANSLCQEIIPCRGRTWYPSGVCPQSRAPRRTAQTAPPRVLPALQPSQDGAAHPFRGDKVFYCLENHQTKKIHSLVHAVKLAGAIQPAGPVPGIEEFYLEVGRKVSFLSSVFNRSVFLFPFWVKLGNFLEMWKKSSLSTRGVRALTSCPEKHLIRCPRTISTWSRLEGPQQPMATATKK